MVNLAKVESEIRNYITTNNLSSPDIIMNNLKPMYEHLKTIPDLGLEQLTFNTFCHFAHVGLSIAMFKSHFDH